MALALAKGMLSDAAIPFQILGDEVGVRPGMSDELLFRNISVLVAEDQEGRARELLSVLDEPGMQE